MKCKTLSPCRRSALYQIVDGFQRHSVAMRAFAVTLAFAGARISFGAGVLPNKLQAMKSRASQHHVQPHLLCTLLIKERHSLLPADTPVTLAGHLHEMKECDFRRYSVSVSLWRHKFTPWTATAEPVRMDRIYWRYCAFAMPSRRILCCRVVRFNPSRSAAPPWPATRPDAALRASTITCRSASANVEVCAEAV